VRYIGEPYKEGKPEIIRDGVVVRKGEPAQTPIPGDINAIKWWRSNLDTVGWLALPDKDLFAVLLFFLSANSLYKKCPSLSRRNNGSQIK
jgi:hypothetical protein